MGRLTETIAYLNLSPEELQEAKLSGLFTWINEKDPALKENRTEYRKRVGLRKPTVRKTE